MSLYNRIIDLQKLNQAWERVRKNKPAAGVDNVRFDEFEERKKEELKQQILDLVKEGESLGLRRQEVIEMLQK